MEIDIFSIDLEAEKKRRDRLCMRPANGRRCYNGRMHKMIPEKCRCDKFSLMSVRQRNESSSRFIFEYILIDIPSIPDPRMRF